MFVVLAAISGDVLDVVCNVVTKVLLIPFEAIQIMLSNVM